MAYRHPTAGPRLPWPGVSPNSQVNKGLHVHELHAGRERLAGTLATRDEKASNSAPTVVLVHGALDRSTSFLRTARRLQDMNVVMYDRRGYSGSRDVKPVATDIETHADDLVSVIGDREVVVVGHSLGGLVALVAAQKEPGLIRAVGAYEPPLPWCDWWPSRSRAFATEDPGVFAQGFYDRVVGEGSWAKLTERGQIARQLDGPALVAELAAIRSTEPLVDLARLSVAATSGRGGRSSEHHRRAAEVVAEMAPSGRLIEIEGAAHGAHLSHPDAFAQMIRSVVASAG
jgi:pimeloyl-ACP methyl ester carboxylesterase